MTLRTKLSVYKFKANVSYITRLDLKTVIEMLSEEKAKSLEHKNLGIATHFCTLPRGG